MSKTQPNPPLNICHLADIHLGFRRYHRVTKEGFNQREVDVGLAFREAVQKIVTSNFDIVLIAGDLFHTVRPSNTVLAFAFRMMKVLSARCPVVIIAGNHDSPKRVDTGSALRLFAEIPNVFVADRSYQRFTFPEISLCVHALPHHAVGEIERYDLRADDDSRFQVLLTHAQIGESWMSDYGGTTVSLDSLRQSEWDYIALGHVHQFQELSRNAAYSGSIEFTSTNIWAEAEQRKGYLSVSLPGPVITFENLHSPREVVVLSPIDAYELEADEVNQRIFDALDGIPGGLDGKIVRLEVTRLNRAILRHIDHKRLRSYRSRALNLSLPIRPDNSNALVESNFQEGKRYSLLNELDSFAKEHEVSPQVVTLLHSVKDALDRVHEA